MTTGGGGYSIGFKELYELVTEVSRKVDTLSSAHSQQIGANTERLETHGKALKEIWERINSQKSSSWQINLAIGSGAVSFLTSLAALLIK